MNKENDFNVMENSAIGHNIMLYRKIKGIKASQVAEHLGLKEGTYTRYERGEVAITVTMIQRIAELLKIDPVTLLRVPIGSIIESGNNSPNSIVSLTANKCQTYNDEQMKMTLKLIENVNSLSEKLIILIDKMNK